MASSSTTKKNAHSVAVASTKTAVSKRKPVSKKATVPKKAVKKAPPKKTIKKNSTNKIPKIKPPSEEITALAKPLSKSELIRSIKREPLGHLLIEHTLREANFKGTVSSDKELLEDYATDESIFYIKPQIVIQPESPHDVEIAVKTLSKETKRFPSLSLTPRAAGTGLSGGSLTDSIVIDVSKHLNKIGDVHVSKDKITFTCEPGAMWRDVEKKLKEYDAYIPSYPASKDICSIGGAVGNNAAGPDSLRYGHTADWVESLNVILHDGNNYTIKPLAFKEYKSLIKQDNAHSHIAKQIFTLIEKNEGVIKSARPKTKKNSSGYALWNVINTSVAEFKKNEGTFDLTRLISGSQGTIGIITAITMRAHKIAHNTSLIAVPVFNLAEAGNVVLQALKYNPINLEIFDGLTYDLAMKNPNFFRSRLSSFDYYRVLLSMYTTYHVRYGRKTPEFTLLVTIDEDTIAKHPEQEIVRSLRQTGATKARLISNPAEKEMLWQIRHASYSLSKLEDVTKRPAAFLEDMAVPPKNLARFFMEIKKLLKKYNVKATVHGHGGNGHFHFYPLLDFTNRTTPALVVKMAEEFFNVAVKYDGNICGEHNDGIIRTPHLAKMFSRSALDLFKQVENIFDPDDIFNPGKKVKPRFDIQDSIRHIN